MKTVIITLLASVLAAGAFAQGASPQVASAPEPVAAQAGSNADIGFLTQALAGGEHEIAMARLAVAQSGSAEVRSLASTLIDDHTATDRELVAAAGLPEPGPSADDRRSAARLSKMSGALFDRTWLEMMAQDHQQAISLFQENAVSASDSATRELASATLPTLRQHLVAVQTLQKKLLAN